MDTLTAIESVFRVLLFESVGVDDILLLSSDLLKDKPVFPFPSLLLYVYLFKLTPYNNSIWVF